MRGPQSAQTTQEVSDSTSASSSNEQIISAHSANGVVGDGRRTIVWLIGAAVVLIITVGAILMNDDGSDDNINTSADDPTLAADAGFDVPAAEADSAQAGIEQPTDSPHPESYCGLITTADIVQIAGGPVQELPTTTNISPAPYGDCDWSHSTGLDAEISIGISIFSNSDTIYPGEPAEDYFERNLPSLEGLGLLGSPVPELGPSSYLISGHLEERELGPRDASAELEWFVDDVVHPDGAHVYVQADAWGWDRGAEPSLEELERIALELALLLDRRLEDFVPLSGSDS